MRSDMGICDSDVVGCDRHRLWTPSTCVHANRRILVQSDILNSARATRWLLPHWPSDNGNFRRSLICAAGAARRREARLGARDHRLEARIIAQGIEVRIGLGMVQPSNG